MEKVSQHENEGKKKESGTDISTDVCLFLFIGLIVGWQKTAELVKQAIQSISYALTKVNLFHSDRGKEFDNQLIEEMLETFGITRSLSQAGCPYDNAVAESTYRSFKYEGVKRARQK